MFIQNEGGRQVDYYLAADVDAFMTAAGLKNWATQANRIASLEKALGYILTASGGECENYTSSIGSCLRNGRTPDAKYGEDRCCWSCLANISLMGG